MSNNKVDVIVSNCTDRIGYNILRSLALKRLRVGIGVDLNKGMAYNSKYVSHRFIHNDIYGDEKEFVSNLKAAIIRLQPNVYIPSYEEIFIVNKYFDELTALNVKIPINKTKTLIDLHCKDKSTEIARSADVPIPETIRPNSKDDIKKFMKEYNEPLLFKLSDSSGSKGCFYLQNKNLEEKINIICKKTKKNLKNFIVQEYVHGFGYGVSVIMNNGKLRAKFCHKRLREKKFSGGPSTVRLSVKNVMLEEYAEAILSKVKHHGVAMVEFRYCEKSKKGWFIEVNPRFWGSLSLAIQSGVNFPYLLYCMAMDGDIEKVEDYKVGIKVKWILGDIIGILSMIRNGEIPSIKDIFYKVDGFDDLYADDPVIFLDEIRTALRRKIWYR